MYANITNNVTSINNKIPAITITTCLLIELRKSFTLSSGVKSDLSSKTTFELSI